MTPLPCRLWNLAATLSLLLSLATLIALPLSFFRALGVVRTHDQSSQVVRVVTGFVTLNDQRGPGMPAFFKMTDQTPHTWLFDFAPTGNVKIYWEYVLRPRYYAPDPPASAIHRHMLILPLWLLAALFSLPKTVPAIVRRLRRPPPPPGHCPACGYDRRATPTRCPECGTTRPPTPAAADATPTPSALT